MIRRVLIVSFALSVAFAGALSAAEKAAEPAKKKPTAEKPMPEASQKTKYVFRANNRRDPFEMQLGGGDTVDTLVVPKILTRKDQVAKVAQCEKWIVEMMAYKAQKKYDRVFDLFGQVTKAGTLITEPDLQKKMYAIRDRSLGMVKDLENGALMLAARRVDEALERMRSAFEAENYDKVLSEYEGVQTALKKIQMRNSGGSMASMAKKLKLAIAAASELNRRAGIRAEFLRQVPSIGGVFITPHKNAVIIDGKYVEEGKKIGNITVFKIEKVNNIPHITFLYKGEHIVVRKKP